MKGLKKTLDNIEEKKNIWLSNVSSFFHSVLYCSTLKNLKF